MDQNTAEKLHERNRRLIHAVIRKAESDCPGSVALIGITGSFATGDFHEKSDLDLCIVINDEAGRAICRCFILEDVGHDIYCITWDDLERLSEYPDPHTTKLMSARLVYRDCAESEARYLALREKLRTRLSVPPDRTDFRKAERFYREALAAFGELMLAESEGELRFSLAELLYRAEYVLFMLNREWIHGSIRRIPEELASLKCRPDGFMAEYRGLIHAQSSEEVRTRAARLMESLGRFVKAAERSLPKEQPGEGTFDGVYEEITSNWKNKMYLAAETDDAYLSLMSAASCQMLYRELAAAYDIAEEDCISGFDPMNLTGNTVIFDEAMERFRESVQKNICRYNNIDEFEKDYLR